MRASIGLIVALAACTSSPVSTAPSGSSTPAAATTTVDSNMIESATSTAGTAVAGATGCEGSVDDVVTIQYREIDGVDPDLLSLDIHSPTNPVRCPAVIWVHGGSWQVGDKATTATVVKAEHFVNAGHVFVSVNYRLVDEANGVRWPDFGSDVASAAAWVIDNAGEIGVDPDRVALVGHSAGAHLVSIVATNPDLLAAFGRERSDIACIVSLDSVTHDLTDQPTFERDIVQAAFGDDLTVLADGSPTLQANEHADDGPVGEFLIVTRGRDVRLRSAARLEAALLASGATASVYDASPYDHRNVNVQLGEPGESNVTPAVTGFLTDCLG